MLTSRAKSLKSRAGPRLVAVFLFVLQFGLPSNTNAVSFSYDPIGEPILSASFSADFAALTAHRTIAGFEVNSVVLTAGSFSINLSDGLFGTTEALVDAAIVDQGPLGTGIITAAIDPSFFPALFAGRIGLTATFTDTFDGIFAIDFLSLTVVTATETIVAFIDRNDGFDIGIADGASLPSPLPDSIPIGATGTGFDESIGSISFQPAPEPGVMLLLISGLGMLALCRRRAASEASGLRNNRSTADTRRRIA